MPTFIIGRDASSADIVVSVPTVSRGHLRVTTLAGDRYRLEDLKSTGGTFVRRHGGWSRIELDEVAADERLRLADHETSIRELLAKAAKPPRPAKPEAGTPASASPAAPAAAAAAAAAAAPSAEPPSPAKPHLDIGPHSTVRPGQAPPPIEAGYDVFVSYAREDLERVRPLVQLMERQGWRVFWDRNIHPGQQWADVIDRALRNAKAVVVVWTAHSTRSEWVRAEAMVARELDRLVPVRLDDTPIPLPFGLIQTTDFASARSQQDQHAMVQQLVTSLSGFVSRPLSATSSALLPFKPTNTIRQTDWLHVLFNLEGRISRKQFWLALLIFSPVFLALKLLIESAVALTMPHTSIMERGITSGILNYSATAYVFMALYGKRLHDFGWSAWWQLPIHVAMLVMAPMVPVIQTANLEDRAVAQSLAPILGVVSIASMLVGALMLFIGLRRGHRENNRYGPPPSGLPHIG